MDSRFLNRFCESDASAPFKRAPFINGDYVLATDGVTAAYVKKYLVEDADSLQTFDKDYIGVLKNANGDNTYNVKLTMDDLVNAIKGIEFDHEESHICPDCKGRGLVEFEYVSVEGCNTYTVEDTCPVCHGGGYNENYQFSHILYAWFNKRKNAVNIKGCWLNPKYVEKLVFLMGDCDVSECTFVRGGKNKGCHFKVTEDIEVVIMPLFHSDEVKTVVEVEC